MSASNQFTYIFGVNQEPLIIQFNIQNMTLKKIPVPPNAKINNWSSALAYQDQIYITGGINETGKIISNECFLFKPDIGDIQELQPFTQCRYVHQTLHKDNKLYLLGGRQYGPDFESVLNHCEVYEDGQWKVISPMLKRRSNFSIFLYNNKIHAIGGFDGKKHTKSIEYYDENMNIWLKLKLKLNRGNAGFSLMPYGNHQILISGGMTQQGPSQACHIINLKDQTILGDKKLNEIRTLPQTVQIDDQKFLLFGGMIKPNKFEMFDNDEWKIVEDINITGLEDLLDTGIRGFATSQQIIEVKEEIQMMQQINFADPENISFFIGNDEFPYLLPIDKNGDIHNKLAVPHQLRLTSYMSTCSVESVLPNCYQIFLCGGIDSRISNITKKAYLVTILFPEMKVKAKTIGKLQYYRYAAGCIFKYPYVYVLGGRGYQNDLLSLHRTVERFNVEEEEWDQVSPLSEAKCSLTAQVINDELYVFGGYVGEGQISHRIERFNEAQKNWKTLTVELPFALEGLASVMISSDEILIIGGKGLEGSRKEIIYYSSEELEEDNNSNGKIIGELEFGRSLPKLLHMNNEKILVIGGQFVDNQEASFGEIISAEGESETDAQQILSTLEQKIGTDYLNMYSLVQ